MQVWLIVLHRSHWTPMISRRGRVRLIVGSPLTMCGPT
jgi:hypothetical protein